MIMSTMALVVPVGRVRAKMPVEPKKVRNLLEGVPKFMEVLEVAAVALQVPEVQAVTPEVAGEPIKMTVVAAVVARTLPVMPAIPPNKQLLPLLTAK